MLSRCQQSMGEPVVLPVGMSGEDALRALWEPVLGGSTNWSLDAGGRILAAPRVYAEDADRLASGVTLMADLGCEVFADRLGRVVLRPSPDPMKAAIARTYAEGPNALITTLDRSGTAWPFNRSIVISEGPDQPTVRGLAEITDHAHPFHRDNVGLRVAPVYRTGTQLAQDAADAVALARLWQMALFADAIATNLVPDPAMDEGDVVAVTQSLTATSAAYWVESVTCPLFDGDQSFSGPRVLPVLSVP